ncbi:alpha/beta hydrolase [uncultured Sphingomonas sp.]|uniref:alpha/beta hydrolase n=1 Tax=uncultured Sphingomonas sp. TaxID=158754 RepID=UPI0025DCEB76|nr:alpha/beta hydrolase [uncultured Sphingomonas sp.]
MRDRRWRRPALAATLMALTGCTGAGLLNGLDRLTPGGDGATRVVRGAAYGSQQRQALDVWVPTARRYRGQKLPVLVFFYGGGWDSGSRGDYGFAGAAYAGQGFVTVVPDYRLVPAVRFPAFVEDGALALRWARENVARYGGDPERITLAGHSAGGYIAAMLALDRRWLDGAGVDPRTVKAAALLAAPLDFAPFTESRGRNAFAHWSDVRATQPISFARADAPPIFLAHGTADRVVFPRNSQRLAARLQSLGAPATLRLYPGANHTDLVVSLARPFRRKTPALRDTAAFLRSATAPPTSGSSE